MVVHGKPDPEPYRRGAELLGLSPADCIVVEGCAVGRWRRHFRWQRVLGCWERQSGGEVARCDVDRKSLDAVSVTAKPEWAGAAIYAGKMNMASHHSR